MIYDLWSQLAPDILAALQADEVLGQRPIVLVSPGEVQSGLNALADLLSYRAGYDGRCGAGAMVLPVQNGKLKNPSMPGCPFTVPLRVQWFSDTIINTNRDRGTQLPVIYWARRTARVLQLHTPVLFMNSFVPDDPCVEEFLIIGPDGKNILQNKRGAEVRFLATEADTEPILRLNRPTVTVEGDLTRNADGSVTINSGAAAITLSAAGNPDSIWWTSDGSHPWPRNNAATLWNGNIVQINGPCLFRARSFKAGYIASDTAAVNFAGFNSVGLPANAVEPPLPIGVVNGQYFPTVDDSGNTLYRPFWDPATNSKKYVYIRNSTIVIGDVPP